MIDTQLACRILNKMGKHLVNAFSSSVDPEQREQLQKALNDLTFMYDVLHLSDTIDCINIEQKPNK